ncbi:IucA/IucC family protein [Geomicrobium sp. JCM 19038]|uniref:IucA/IucC family protein n=1 Tax=Geomicrobium sp. JCM 19038 TaxID=1460635 RepID=UPI00045F1350|nr:IucA/IucC family protein [Geomicrobium sp. JCM 19038]GAK08042.1 siderophore synthetase superfamily, group B [Geomicrobium sp. JCM 19038]
MAPTLKVINAETLIIQDLIQALRNEGFFPLDQELPLLRDARPEIQRLFGVEEETVVYEHDLCFLLERRAGNELSWKLGSPIYRREQNGWTLLKTAAEIARSTLDMNQVGARKLIESIETSIHQLQLSIDHLNEQENKELNHSYDWFIESERVASYRDRPFHPTAKAKIGFTDQQYKKYMAEFGCTMQLYWVAVKKDAMVTGETSLSPIDGLPLEEQKLLEEESGRQGVTPEDYTLMPVHPWQMEVIIKSTYEQEIKEGIIVLLETRAGDYVATSSLRSLATEEPSSMMLKLPVSVTSLGASRYLPVVKLLNGGSGERLLRQAIECDDVLTEKVYLCDERHWWGYMPESKGWFDEQPRHLAAQQRLYPEELTKEPYRMITMSALGAGVASEDFLKQLLGDLDVETFFDELVELFYTVVMRLFKIGVVPEIHGQNCCIVVKHGKPVALLFRDHDSVRLHPPYTERYGLEDPNYRIRPGYSNSLYNNTVDDLLFYVQTLGTEVNIRSVIETFAQTFEVTEEELWLATKQRWQEALKAVGFSEFEEQRLHVKLFEADHWPVKQILKPLLDVDGVPGAMPSGKGQGHNPFKRILGGV